MSSQRYQQNGIYFFVLFADTDLRVPIIRTLRYLRVARREDGAEVLLFEDMDSDAIDRKLSFAAEEAEEVVLGGPELLVRLKDCFEGTLGTPSPRDPNTSESE